MKKATQNPKSELSVQNGIKVLKTAIKSKLSLSEASRRNDLGRNYVSDIKSRLADNLAKKNVSRDTYKTFKTLLKEYEKSV